MAWKRVVGGVSAFYGAVVNPTLALLEHYDYISHQAEEVQKNRTLMEYILHPPVWSSIVLVLVGLAFIYWDVRRQRPANQSFSDAAAKVYPHLSARIPWWKKLRIANRENNERTPLLDLVRLVFQFGRSPDLQEFQAALRQAGSDGTIQYWGRRQRYASDELNKNEPLIEIPRSHWIDFQFEVLDMFHWDNRGNISSVHTDNFRTYTRTPSRDRRTETFVDIHLPRGQAERFAKLYVSTP